MSSDVALMVKTFIELGTQYDEEDVCLGLEILKEEWPGLTAEERKEIACVIKAYRKTTLEENEDLEETCNQEKKRTLTLEEETKGFFGMFRK